MQESNFRKLDDTPGLTMSLARSASEQNVFLTYVCLVDEVKPSLNFRSNKVDHGPSFHLLEPEPENIDVANEEEPIQVERSKALYELIESYKKLDNVEVEEIESIENSGTAERKSYPTSTSGEDSEPTDVDVEEFISFDNPNVLKLTKMKWLSEEQQGSPDSSSTSLSPTRSTTSTYSQKSGETDEKYLSTILRLDKEHNLFGLSNIAIVGSRPSKRKKDDDKPVFPQTAIVQVCCTPKGCCKKTCCSTGCCRHRSNTDLPASLKCRSGCGGCSKCLSACYLPTCAPPCDRPVSCPTAPSCIPRCNDCCSPFFGLKVKVNRHYLHEPAPVELTPRSSCILSKPLACRSCHHTPPCLPPSSCFPYLMPCFWPSRPSAPCNEPRRCFHNPPCIRAKMKPMCTRPEEYCPMHGKKCTTKAGEKCENRFCFGKDKDFVDVFTKRFSGEGSKVAHK